VLEDAHDDEMAAEGRGGHGRHGTVPTGDRGGTHLMVDLYFALGLAFGLFIGGVFGHALCT